MKKFKTNMIGAFYNFENKIFFYFLQLFCKANRFQYFEKRIRLKGNFNFIN